MTADDPLRARDSADRIVDEAKCLFLENGYAGVNLEQIASAAGVARQTVYNRFGSKEAVFRATVETHWALLDPGDPTAYFVAGPEHDDPVLVLRRIADSVWRFIVDHQQVAFTQLVVSEAQRRQWIATDFYRAGKEPLAAGIADGLRRMDAAGNLACPNPELAARQFLGIVQEFILWPDVMAIGDLVDDAPAWSAVVDEAIQMFLSRYGAD